jgi:bacterioferritin (cytochrome b1)
MVTLAGTQDRLVDVLDSLMKLDLDAMEAYDLAIGNAERPDIRERLEQFKEDHVRHADDLAQLVAKLGGEPNKGPAEKQLLPEDPFVSASVTGDHSLLERLLSREKDTNAAYERSLEAAQGDQAAKDLLTRNLEDERRHRAWIEETLASL